MTSLKAQMKNMKVTSEWRLDRLFLGYAAKMPDE